LYDQTSSLSQISSTTPANELFVDQNKYKLVIPSLWNQIKCCAPPQGSIVASVSCEPPIHRWCTTNARQYMQATALWNQIKCFAPPQGALVASVPCEPPIHRWWTTNARQYMQATFQSTRQTSPLPTFSPSRREKCAHAVEPSTSATSRSAMVS
jgi:hypothetical protein